VLLGALVSRITGAHWSEFVQERIFEPAGMGAVFRPYAADAFFAEDSPVRITFERDPSAVTAGLRMEIGTFERRARKIR
jgi:CubicO group peptidase (beta-lactamase class C family)